MRINEHIKILGKRVILVPYEAKHVPKYHEWMQSKELQELTASEPLSLEEEYEMQRSWREDEDKCTFLILCRTTYDQTQDEILSLVGDTNLFLSLDEETSEKIAETEIMIAEAKARGKGYGWEAMLLMMKYAQENLSIGKFEAKIGMENAKSIKMFEKMHFKEVRRVDVFKEITYERIVDKSWLEWLNKEVNLQIEVY
ncbi:alpha/beta-tubulin-N-acetyltransferase 9 [Stomoxys calcitrans]|uniref:alpha/beta-tubulin-N-acetyltransferase 9 n=1 Tax=Stomoxys calcitrans TaxID=35570 RepID=UPI0027E24639|nr:alpha/beta-tubulin-N-acetyltransferase 9 [Stomoxys calcitrans]